MSDGMPGTRRLVRGMPGVAPPTRAPMTYRTSGPWATGPIPRSSWRRSSGLAMASRRWSEKVEHAGYSCRPIRIRERVEQADRAAGGVRGLLDRGGTR
jgi:hypothetical protein